jgi:hypothetical protein
MVWDEQGGGARDGFAESEKAKAHRGDAEARRKPRSELTPLTTKDTKETSEVHAKLG